MCARVCVCVCICTPGPYLHRHMCVCVCPCDPLETEFTRSHRFLNRTAHTVPEAEERETQSCSTGGEAGGSPSIWTPHMDGESQRMRKNRRPRGCCSIAYPTVPTTHITDPTTHTPTTLTAPTTPAAVTTHTLTAHTAPAALTHHPLPLALCCPHPRRS